MHPERFFFPRLRAKVIACYYFFFSPSFSSHRRRFPEIFSLLSERTDFPFQKFPFSWPQGPKGKKWEKRKEGDYSIFQECGSERESLCALIRFNFFFFAIRGGDVGSSRRCSICERMVSPTPLIVKVATGGRHGIRNGSETISTFRLNSTFLPFAPEIAHDASEKAGGFFDGISTS